MSFNTFGHLFRVTTWGESHGPAIGATVDGCPPGILLVEADLQPWLDASPMQRIGRLGVCVVAGAATYFATLFVLGLRPLHLRNVLPR